MPDFWQSYAKQHFQSEPVAAGVSPDPPKPANAEAAKIGGQVSAPVVLFSPEPKFSEEARHVGNLNGNVLVYLRVGLDGLPYAVRILRPFGVGLDERAVEAVKAYRFKPAMRDGQPVRVEMNVEVNFRRW
jgi:protein TonB